MLILVQIYLNQICPSSSVYCRPDDPTGKWTKNLYKYKYNYINAWKYIYIYTYKYINAFMKYEYLQIYKCLQIYFNQASTFPGSAGYWWPAVDLPRNIYKYKDRKTWRNMVWKMHTNINTNILIKSRLSQARQVIDGQQ